MPVNMLNIRRWNREAAPDAMPRWFLPMNEATFSPMRSGIYKCNQTDARVPQARLAGYRTMYRLGGPTVANGWLKGVLKQKRDPLGFKRRRRR